MGEKGKKIWTAIKSMMAARGMDSEALAEQSTISIDDFDYLSKGYVPTDTVILSIEKALGYVGGSVQKHVDGIPLEKLILLKDMQLTKQKLL